MRYIGAILPEFPANTFVTSIYRDEDDTLFEHIIENGRIEGFSPLKGLLYMEPHFIEAPVRVQENEAPVFSYVKEDGTFYYGRYIAIFPKLAPLVNDDGLNDIAKIILTSFLSIHGITHRLIQQYSGRSVILMREENFLPLKDLSPNAVSIEELLYRTLEREKLYKDTYRFTLKDLIYHNDAYTYVGNYRVSNDLLADFMDSIDPSDELWEITMRLLMSYSSKGSGSPAYMKMASIFRNDTSWIPQEAFCRARAEDYGELLAEKAPEVSIVALGFAAENKIHRNSMEDSDPDRKVDKEKYNELVQKVKSNIKKNRYESFF